MPSYTTAHNAFSGRFISLAEAKRYPSSSVVETFHISRNGERRLTRRIGRYRRKTGQR